MHRHPLPVLSLTSFRSHSGSLLLSSCHAVVCMICSCILDLCKLWLVASGPTVADQDRFLGGQCLEILGLGVQCLEILGLGVQCVKDVFSCAYLHNRNNILLNIELERRDNVLPIGKHVSAVCVRM
jgi:hypothetical protein